MSSIEKQIQDAVVALVTANKSSVKAGTDTRVPAVLSVLPSELKQAVLPILVVEEFAQDGDPEFWENGVERIAYAAKVSVIDGFKVGPKSEAAAKAKIRDLWKKLRAVFRANDSLGLVGLWVLPGFWDLSAAGPFEESKDDLAVECLMKSTRTLRVYVLVEDES